MDLETLTPECDSCHGPKGVSTQGDIPSIAGKSQALLEKSLRQFQSMDRPCKRTEYRHGYTTMCEVAAKLDEPAIRALGQHYASQAFTPAPQEFDAAKAVAGASLHSLYCESCHPKGGSESGYAGRLAGQWLPYLECTINQIRSGELIVPHMMERKLSEFSDEEIELLLNFWASQQG